METSGRNEIGNKKIYRKNTIIKKCSGNESKRQQKGNFQEPDKD